MKEWLVPMLIGIVMFVLGGPPNVSPPDEGDRDREEVIDDSWDDSGSGFEDSAGEVSPSTPAVITMVTQPNCPPCEQWWRVERPKWEAMGWTVEKTDASGSGFDVTPSFVIADRDGTEARYEGYLTTSAATRLLSRARSGPPSATGQTLVNGRHQVAGEWTFDGGVSDHLMGGNHRFSPEQLAGKSQGELERMHSIDHQRYGPVPAAARGRQTTVALQSSCPTGGCPTSSSSVVNRRSVRSTGPVRQAFRNWRR